jgi:aminopeptidase N
MENKESLKNYPLKREEAEFRKSELSDSDNNYHVNYNLFLTLRKSSHSNQSYEKNNFEGRLSVKFAYFGKEERDLFLNFNGDVHSVKINGSSSEISYSEKRIYLDRKKLRKNSKVSDQDLNEVIILFSAKYSKTGLGLHHFIDPIDQKEYLYTQFEPYHCHNLFPVFDQPNIKATLDLTLVGPKDWVLLSNEYEKSTLDLNSNEALDLLKNLTGDEKTFLVSSIKDLNYKISPFNTTYKISSYLYAICAGPYHCINDSTKYKVPLRLFMRESLKNYGEPEEFFRITIAGMEWYKNFFGLPYPFTKYDQIFSPEYNYGAMENVGLVTYNENYCWKEPASFQKRSRLCITILHELAHMWFGNLVTMKWWEDLWLNESFATFISFLCQAQTLGQDYPTSWLSFNAYKGIAYREDQKSTTHPVMADISDTDKAESLFDAIVYYKGSSLLKQMFYFIGQDNFSNGLKAYFKKYAWTNTVFEDFVGQMAESLNQNGEVKFDLLAVSKAWITQAGLNQVESDWEESPDGTIKSFKIKQIPCLSQHANLQVHMMDILFIYENENVEHKCILIHANEYTNIDSLVGLKAPKAVVLNYNDWAYVKWIVDNKSLEYLGHNLIEKVPDTLSRQMFYRSLYELTRDAKISCPAFLDIIVKLLQHETNDEVLSTTLRNISGLIAYYLPVKFYPYYSSLMFELVEKILAQNLSNKEIVINLLELIIVFAHDDEHVGILKSWLENGPWVRRNGVKVEIPSSLLNQDNRFTIVALVHRSRHFSAEEKAALLKEEVKRDGNSDRSVRARCRCHASLPDYEIKKELWDKFTNNPDSESLHNMRSYMSGFSSIDQLELVETFVNEKFFEDAIKIASKDIFYVDAFISYCGPIFTVNNTTIEKLEALAEKTKDFDICRRRLLEMSDDMRRYLRAQQMAELYLSLLNRWKK